VAVFTHAQPGQKLWWSLSSIGELLHWERPGGKRKWTSAYIYDRLPTWERLCVRLRLPSCFRRSLPVRGAKVQAPVGRATKDPIGNTARFLVIMLRHVYNLRSTSHSPHENAGDAKPVLHARLERFPLPTKFPAYLDSTAQVSSAGFLSGKNMCWITVTTEGNLDLAAVRLHAQQNSRELTVSKLNAAWYAEQDATVSLYELFVPRLCQMKL
jgi:hypothetical protein